MSQQNSVVDKIIQKWFPVIGMAFMVGALLYLFYDGLWGGLGKNERMFVGFITGLGLISGGYAFSEKLKHYADVVIGGGAVVLYATFLYATRFPDVGINKFQSPEIMSLLVGFVFAASIAFYSIQRKSKYILGIGMIAGYITPLVLAYFGSLLNFADAKDLIVYDSSFITFFLYFIGVNITALYASSKMSLKGFGLFNSLGLFIGTLSLLALSNTSEFIKYAEFTAIVSLGVMTLHVSSMVNSAKTFKNENDPYLYAGYILPLVWFVLMIANINGSDGISSYLETVLYLLSGAVFFGLWYYLKNLTSSNKHFGLYIGGFLSIIGAIFAFVQDLNEFQGIIVSLISVIFAVLYIIKPILQRLIAYISFAVFGLVLTIEGLAQASGKFLLFNSETLLLSFALLPFIIAFLFKEADCQETKEAIYPVKVLASLSSLAIVALIGYDALNGYNIAKDFLFLTIPAIAIAIYSFNLKNLENKFSALITSLVVGTAGYFLTAFELLEKTGPNTTHSDILLGSQASRIGFITFVLFAFIYFQIKKLGNKVEDGTRFFSVFAPVVVFLQFIANEIIAFYNQLGISSSSGKTDGIMALTQSVSWSIMAVYLIYLGLKKDSNRIEKNIGFGVLALTVVKIFVYDLSNADSSLIVILLMVIGSLIMGISYIYNKKDTSKEIDSK